MNSLEFGNLKIDRIVELERWMFEPADLFPTITPDVINKSKKWLDHRFIDPLTGLLILASQSYVIRTGRRVILIDTCIGNDKNRPTFSAQHQLKTPYLENLKRLNLAPEDIDVVLCTHLHPDHCGWNTRLSNGKWVPTFPNAKYVMNNAEFEYFKEMHSRTTRTPDREELSNAFKDSILPVVDSGQAVFVKSDQIANYELDQGIWLEETAGHTPGHVIVHVKKRNSHAIMVGDVIHHPLQFKALDLPVYGDFDSSAAGHVRRRFVEGYADTQAIILAGHFPSPTAGCIVSDGGEYDFKWL